MGKSGKVSGETGGRVGLAGPALMKKGVRGECITRGEKRPQK